MKHFASKREQERIGPVAQKVLVLLLAGAALSLTTRPDHSIRIIKSAVKEWKKINQRSLREAIKRLYRSKLIDYDEHKDGTITLVLNEDGRRRAVRYDLNRMTIPKPARWDGLWRMALFDIPEPFKKGRNALALQLKQMGFHQLQKSVFIHPYPCKDEIDCIVEVFALRPYVRFAVVKEIDVGLDLTDKFRLR